jgi:hypothetical protein
MCPKAPDLREFIRRWLEARGGIEPPNKGFADLILTHCISSVINNSGPAHSGVDTKTVQVVLAGATPEGLLVTSCGEAG